MCHSCGKSVLSAFPLCLLSLMGCIKVSFYLPPGERTLSRIPKFTELERGKESLAGYYEGRGVILQCNKLEKGKKVFTCHF